MQKAVELSEDDSQMLGWLGYGYGVSGQRSRAFEVIKELEEKYRQQKAGGTEIAAVYLGLDKKDQAFAWLEKDIQSRRRSSLIEIKRDWVFQSLRDDPRFPDLARRIGLAP